MSSLNQKSPNYYNPTLQAIRSPSISQWMGPGGQQLFAQLVLATKFWLLWAWDPLWGLRAARKKWDPLKQEGKKHLCNPLRRNLIREWQGSGTTTSSGGPGWDTKRAWWHGLERPRNHQQRAEGSHLKSVQINKDSLRGQHDREISCAVSGKPPALVDPDELPECSLHALRKQVWATSLCLTINRLTTQVLSEAFNSLKNKIIRCCVLHSQWIQTQHSINTVSYAQSQQTYGIYGHTWPSSNHNYTECNKTSMCISNAKKVQKATNPENFYTHSCHRTLI